MRHAPAYSAERFPGDFMASLLAGLVFGSVSGAFAWWLSRRFLLAHNPGHPELFGAAVVVGLLDGLLLCVLSFVAAFAVRIWRFERRARKSSDEALRRELQAIAQETSSVNDAQSDTPPRPDPQV